MKRIIMLSTISLVLSLAITHRFSMEKTNQSIQEIENQEAYVSPQVDEMITMKEMADFLSQKKEHYPLSDEFIEKYQQDGGGYIDYARQKGLVVDKTLHEPNQKWHFFTSWLEVLLEEGKITWEEDAKKRVYTYLYCPELVLWVYEATEVEPAKVKKAKEVAEEGKAQKLKAVSIASKMRAIVSWEDVSKAVLASRSTNN